MRRYLTFVFLLVTAITDGADAPTVLIYGDSLSAGYGMDVDQSWVALLQTRLHSQGYEHRVINASITGETTEGGAARIAQALDTFTPSLIILELGGNDGLRGIPPDRMKGNLQTIIQSSKSAGAAIVLLGIRIPPTYGSRYIEDFDNVYRERADELDVPCIEVVLEGIALNDELMQADGIHPNAAAQSLLLDNAWPVISKALTN